jgi:Brp/Blh family beta-carotene 15,15'-monooxygenase
MDAVSSSYRTTIVYTLTAVVAIAAQMLFPDVVTIGCALAIAMLGVPHGSLDLHLLSTRSQRLRELAIYLGSIAVVLAVWYVAPSIMLAIFLLNSAWHFGDCDIRLQGRWRTPVVMLYGLATLVLLIQPADASVLWIIEELVGQPVDVASTPLANLYTSLWPRVLVMVSVVMLPLIDGQYWRSTLPRGILMVIVSLTVPSLLAFTWYFVAVHSWTSMDRLRYALDHASPWTWRRLLLAAAPLSVITFVGIAIASMTVSTAGVLTVLFVALSALTVPHSRLFRRVYS